MPLASFYAVLRAHDEGALFVGFFGFFAIMAALEIGWPRNEGAPLRRRRWLTNGMLTLLFVVVNGLIPVTLIAAAEWAQQRGVGLLYGLSGLPALAIPLGFLIRSLVSWSTHLLLHKVPWLWRVHRVHHYDATLDVSTAGRFHPLEPLIVTPIALAAVVGLGLDPVAVLLYELTETVFSVVTHANVRWPASLDRMARLILITPDLHRIHHSPWQPETDSNYGSTLSVWDRIFGTYRVKPADALATQPIGLDDCRDDRTGSWLWLLAVPFRNVRSGIGAQRTGTNRTRPAG